MHNHCYLVAERFALCRSLAILITEKKRPFLQSLEMTIPSSIITFLAVVYPQAHVGCCLSINSEPSIRHVPTIRAVNGSLIGSLMEGCSVHARLSRRSLDGKLLWTREEGIQLKGEVKHILGYSSQGSVKRDDKDDLGRSGDCILSGLMIDKANTRNRQCAVEEDYCKLQKRVKGDTGDVLNARLKAIRIGLSSKEELAAVRSKYLERSKED